MDKFMEDFESSIVWFTVFYAAVYIEKNKFVPLFQLSGLYRSDSDELLFQNPKTGKLSRDPIECSLGWHYEIPGMQKHWIIFLESVGKNLENLRETIETILALTGKHKKLRLDFVYFVFDKQTRKLYLDDIELFHFQEEQEV